MKKNNYFKILTGRIFEIIALIILFYFAYLAWQKIFDINSFPFRHVKIVTDQHHVPIHQIETIIIKNLKGGFFSLKESELKNSLTTLPWVDAVSIRRVWPDTLVVSLSEQKALARWNNEAVFNRNGIVFTPPIKTIPNNLPSLIGPADSQEEVFNQFIILQKQLSTLHLGISNLTLNDRHSWLMVLSNGIKVIIGDTDVDNRITKFLEFYPQLIKNKSSEIKYVDLRYSNGMAVKWKDGQK